MPLQPGTTLGLYQIDAPLGARGMGEVYQATDTRLDRTVAIKVLPEHVAADPDLKQRFERETRTVAALNHPHISRPPGPLLVSLMKSNVIQLTERMEADGSINRAPLKC